MEGFHPFRPLNPHHPQADGEAVAAGVDGEAVAAGVKKENPFS